MNVYHFCDPYDIKINYPWPVCLSWSIVLYTKRLQVPIPGQGTYLGCAFDLWSGLVQEAIK